MVFRSYNDKDNNLTQIFLLHIFKFAFFKKKNKNEVYGYTDLKLVYF